MAESKLSTDKEIKFQLRVAHFLDGGDEMWKRTTYYCQQLYIKQAGKVITLICGG